jgi:MFS family permease
VRTPRPPLPREVRVLIGGTLVNRAGTFVQPFLVLYLTIERGFTASQAGLVVAAAGFGGMFSQLLGGWCTDHIGRRTTLVAGLVLSAGALVSLGLARGTVAIMVAAALEGLFGDLYRPASQALIADVLPPEQRPYAFALTFWAVNLGFSIAAVSAGIVAEHAYWILFAVDAATSLLYAGVVLVGIRRDPPRVRHEGGGVGPGFATALRDRTFMVLVGLTVLQAVAYFQCFLVLPLAMNAAGLGPSTYGVVAATNGIVIVALQPVAARVTAGFDPSRLLAASLLLCGVGFWLMSFATTLAAFIACTVVWTLGEIGTAGLLPAIVSDLAQPTARGRYLGLFGTSFGAAAFLAPLIGPPVYQAVGASWVWALCLALFAVAALGNLALRGAVLARRAANAALDPA